MSTTAAATRTTASGNGRNRVGPKGSAVGSLTRPSSLPSVRLSATPPFRMGGWACRAPVPDSPDGRGGRRPGLGDPGMDTMPDGVVRREPEAGLLHFRDQQQVPSVEQGQIVQFVGGRQFGVLVEHQRCGGVHRRAECLGEGEWPEFVRTRVPLDSTADGPQLHVGALEAHHLADPLPPGVLDGVAELRGVRRHGHRSSNAGTGRADTRSFVGSTYERSGASVTESPPKVGGSVDDHECGALRRRAPARRAPHISGEG